MTLFRRIYLSNTYIHGFNFDFNLIFFNLFICCYFCWIFCWCYFCFLMLVVIFSAAIRNAFEYRNAGYVCVCVWVEYVGFVYLFIICCCLFCFTLFGCCLLGVRTLACCHIFLLAFPTAFLGVFCSSLIYFQRARNELNRKARKVSMSVSGKTHDCDSIFHCDFARFTFTTERERNG